MASVKTRHRAFASTQMSTWGTGRSQDRCAKNGKRKKSFDLPGPAHYNHVFKCCNDHRTYTKAHEIEGFKFASGLRDI